MNFLFASFITVVTKPFNNATQDFRVCEMILRGHSANLIFCAAVKIPSALKTQETWPDWWHCANHNPNPCPDIHR
ncbi:hypothetical protein Bresa_00868|uniref:Uncharacterized protein n=1 Tax=Brenneria salicis ATCC 15712 = DSM 30166 TaxID=714314 RepID=A0A366I5P2_9GAMM|nr:hypothetical protein [Brenneria salicis ATCC 15712 = DSM 30166]RBP63494.1 hypothetical protein DES54_1117 [Brenneria salicis ATCC 15712 = DSM 30166]